jgi:hypothetical protein
MWRDVAIFVATVQTQNTNLRSSEISILPFNQVNIDNVFGYDDSTYKYTIQKSGVYMFTASVT